MKNKVKTSFVKLSDNKLSELSSHVAAHLSNNPHFNLGEGSLDELVALTNTYKTLLASWGPKKVRINTDAKNEARKLVEAKMQHLAILVNLQANSDLVILQSSGFPICKTGSSAKPLQFPSGLKAVQGNNLGSIEVSVPANKAAKFYQFCYTDDLSITEPKLMLQVSENHSKVLLTGLKSGVTYKIVATYRNANPQTNYSQPVYVIAP